MVQIPTISSFNEFLLFQFDFVVLKISFSQIAFYEVVPVISQGYFNSTSTSWTRYILFILADVTCMSLPALSTWELRTSQILKVVTNNWNILKLFKVKVCSRNR